MAKVNKVAISRKIRKYLDKWASRLLTEKWIVISEFDPKKCPHCNPRPRIRINAHVRSDYANRLAWMTFHNPKPKYGLERTVLHEVIHCVMEPIDDNFDGLMHVLEQEFPGACAQARDKMTDGREVVVNSFADALMNADREIQHLERKIKKLTKASLEKAKTTT